MSHFYVYQITEDGDIPRYIGKGTGTRHEIHLRLVKKMLKGIVDQHQTYVHRQIVQAIAEDRKFAVDIFAAELSEADAYAKEEELIAQIGREICGTGPLWNVLPGGGFDYEKLPSNIRSEMGRKAAARLTPEQLRVRALKAVETKGPEACRAAALKAAETRGQDGYRTSNLKAQETMGPEGRRAAAAKANETKGPEGRSDAMYKAAKTLGAKGCRDRTRKASATMGAEGLSARSHKRAQRMTQEQRSAIIRSGWVTRRAHAIIKTAT